MVIRQEGLSIVMFRPENKDESDWMKENVEAEPWQWLGGALAVDVRYATYLVDGVVQAGFEVTP